MSGRTSIAIALLLVLAAHAFLIAVGVNPLHLGGGWDHLWDADSYTRVLRVRELAHGAGWYDPTLRFANHPKGFALHWSRLLDLIVLAPALAASPFASFPSALHGWSILLGPAMQIAALLLLRWGTRAFIGPAGFAVFAVLFVSQRGISYDFVPGIVDHHGLQLLCLFGALAALYRSPARPRLAYVAGAFGALGLWASAESMVAVLAVTAGIGVHWIAAGRREDALRLLRYGAAIAVGTAAMLGIERAPQALLEASYERLSIVQVALAVAILNVAAGLVALGRTRAVATLPRRLLGAAALSIIVLAAVIWTFPLLLRNPYDATAEVIRGRILPLIPAEQPFLPTTPELAYNFALEMGPAFFALGYCLLQLGGWGELDEDRRLRYLLSAVAIVVFVAYAIYAFRGLPFLGAAAIVPWTEAVLAAWRRARERLRAGSAGERVAAVAGTAVLSLGPAFTAVVIAVLWMPQFVVSHTSSCRWDQVAMSIPTPESDAPPPGAILSEVFAGPELSYRTGWPVIGAPYHGNADGIAFTYRALEAPPQEALPLLDTRRVRWIALCGALGPEMQAVLGRSPMGLAATLLTGQPPPGLVPVDLPAEVARQFVLYRRVGP